MTVLVRISVTVTRQHSDENPNLRCRTPHENNVSNPFTHFKIQSKQKIDDILFRLNIYFLACILQSNFSLWPPRDLRMSRKTDYGTTNFMRLHRVMFSCEFRLKYSY